MCKNGKMQSPIDLLDKRTSVESYSGKLERNYKPNNATIKNAGHYIMVTWVGRAGSIQINGTQYMLQQCHWHSPSEHTNNGKRFSLEMHMVHASSDQKIAVVAITYEIGRPDTFLSELMEHIESIAYAHAEEVVVGVVNPNHIKIGSIKYYRYMGSLTTPPCTQNVVWSIVDKVRTVSREQVRLLRAAVNNELNARPQQPINKRPVYLYRPRDLQEN